MRRALIGVFMILTASLACFALTTSLDGFAATHSWVRYTSDICRFTAVFPRYPLEKEGPPKEGQKKRYLCMAENGQIMCCVISEEYSEPGKSDGERVDEVYQREFSTSNVKNPARSYKVNEYEVKEYYNVMGAKSFDNDRVLIYVSGTRVYIVMAGAVRVGQTTESIDKFIRSFKPIK
jgi:hypothetical protein